MAQSFQRVMNIVSEGAIGRLSKLRASKLALSLRAARGFPPTIVHKESVQAVKRFLGESLGRLGGQNVGNVLHAAFETSCARQRSVPSVRLCLAAQIHKHAG